MILRSPRATDFDMFRRENDVIDSRAPCPTRTDRTIFGAAQRTVLSPNDYRWSSGESLACYDTA